MALNIKVITRKEKNMVTGLTLGMMAPAMLAIGSKTRLTGLEFTLGLTVESTKVLGKITICMEKEHTHGKMEEDMTVI